MAVEISEHQFCICRDANGQFCNINAPLQPLPSPPSCITALYAKNTASINMRCSLQIRNTNSISIPIVIALNVQILISVPSAMTTGIALICPKAATRSITLWKPIHILHLSPACSATSPHFLLPLCYETLTVNIFLDTPNLSIIDISSLDFCIWQHQEDHWIETQLNHLVKILSVAIAQLYKHMISSNEPITPFTSPDESIADTTSIWTLFLLTCIYMMAIGSLIPTGLGIFCYYLFWCWPARLVCQPLQPGSVWYIIVDGDVEM